MTGEDRKTEFVRLAMALATARAAVGVQMGLREIVQHAKYLEAYTRGAEGLGWEQPNQPAASSALGGH